MFPAFLGIDGALGSQARFQAVQADLFAGVGAVTIVPAIQALQRAVDLADQLAVAVTGCLLYTSRCV